MFLKGLKNDKNVSNGLCRPPGGRQFLLLLLLLFIFFIFPTFFFPELLDMMGELFFWGRKGDWSGLLSGGRWDGIRTWLAEEDTKQGKKRGAGRKKEISGGAWRGKREKKTERKSKGEQRRGGRKRSKRPGKNCSRVAGARKTHGFSDLFFWEEALPSASLVGFLIIFLITFVLHAFSLWVLVFIHCSNVFCSAILSFFFDFIWRYHACGFICIVFVFSVFPRPIA